MTALFGSAPEQLRRACEVLGVARPFAVVDEAFGLSGAGRALAAWKFESVVAEPNPAVERAESVAAAVRASGADVVFAVGGGSAMDLAKLATLGAAGVDLREPRVEDVELLPIVAVPTTSGTGSEATHFAVMWIDDRKHSVAHEALRPRFAVIDPSLTLSVPPAVTAATGLDALCQACESIMAVGATEGSLAHAIEGAELAWEHLDRAVADGGDLDARSGMARAAYLAGRAIDVTKTTAPHAVSYTLTWRHGVPHGHAVALTFGAFLRHNAEVAAADCNDPRGPEAVRDRVASVCRILGGGDPADAAARFRDLVASIGLATRLHEVGVESVQDREAIVAGVNVERLANNPRAVTRAQLEAIVDAVF